MKRIVLFIMVLSMSQAILAEGKSHKLLVNGRTWNYMSLYYPMYSGEKPDTVYESMTIEGPYEFDGKECYTFSNVSLEEGEERNYFYEEGGKVYFYGYNHNKHGYCWKEEFNFNLNPGENGVISVDTILVNGEYYRRLNFSRDVWVEGIGSLECALFSNWGTVPGAFIASKVISVYDGDKCIFTTDNFRQQAVTAHDNETVNEYIDPQTNVVYIYNTNDNSAEVKAGWRGILGGDGEELSEEDFPGSPNVISNVSILDKFEIDGHEYSVSRIGEKAFILTGLTRVVIPKTISSIGIDAFAFSNLISIISYIEDPFDTDAFRYLNTSNITLFVPNGCGMKYKAARGWSNFENIVEMDATGLLLPENVGQLSIRDSIYDLQGHRLSTKPQKGVFIQNRRKVIY